MNKTLLVIVCAAAFLQACSKSEQPEAPPPNLTDASSVPAAKQAIEQKQVAQAPKADKATPLDAYKELTSGKTLMFTYLCSRRLNIDPPYRFNIDPGRVAAVWIGNCG